LPILDFQLFRTISYLQVSESSRVAMNNISVNCGYKNPSAMIMENIDYIINSASHKFRHFSLNLNVTRVLCAVIHKVGFPVAAFLEDTLEEIFDVLDEYHGLDFVCWSLLKGSLSFLGDLGFNVLADQPFLLAFAFAFAFYLCHI